MTLVGYKLLESKVHLAAQTPPKCGIFLKNKYKGVINIPTK
jgi:hypothetical protein